MASITLADAQANLATVNAALQNMIAGTRVTTLKVGSGQFAREYKYQEISLESLRQMQAEYMADVDYFNSLSANTLPTFANNKTIPMVVKKDYFNVWANRGIY